MIEPTFPPQSFSIISVESSIPSNVDSGSIPLSNLYLASLMIFNLRPVDATFSGIKYADSIRIFLVFSSQDEFNPPITPAKLIIFFSSQITIISLSKVYSFSSNPTNFSPFFEFLIVIFPSILSKSNTCNGLQ